MMTAMAMYNQIQTAAQEQDHFQYFNVFSKYENKGLSATLECADPRTIPADDMAFILQLSRDNMIEIYKKGFGWNAQEKAEELMHAEARYIIARDPQTRQMLGFVHYRFELDDDAEYPIVYCYELQLVPHVQGKGLGRHLLQCIELFGAKWGMEMVVLTVQKANPDALRFYQRHKFTFDRTDPSTSDPDDADQYPYYILSKRLPRKKNPVP